MDWWLMCRTWAGLCKKHFMHHCLAAGLRASAHRNELADLPSGWLVAFIFLTQDMKLTPRSFSPLQEFDWGVMLTCLLYTSPSPRDRG
eukprot:1008892-Amphidinium_carterae.1